MTLQLPIDLPGPLVWAAAGQKFPVGDEDKLQAIAGTLAESNLFLHDALARYQALQRGLARVGTGETIGGATEFGKKLDPAWSELLVGVKALAEDSAQAGADTLFTKVVVITALSQLALQTLMALTGVGGPATLATEAARIERTRATVQQAVAWLVERFRSRGLSMIVAHGSVQGTLPTLAGQLALIATDKRTELDFGELATSLAAGAVGAAIGHKVVGRLAPRLTAFDQNIVSKLNTPWKQRATRFGETLLLAGAAGLTGGAGGTLAADLLSQRDLSLTTIISAAGGGLTGALLGGAAHAGRAKSAGAEVAGKPAVEAHDVTLEDGTKVFLPTETFGPERGRAIAKYTALNAKWAAITDARQAANHDRFTGDATLSPRDSSNPAHSTVENALSEDPRTHDVSPDPESLARSHDGTPPGDDVSPSEFQGGDLTNVVGPDSAEYQQLSDHARGILGDYHAWCAETMPPNLRLSELPKELLDFGLHFRDEHTSLLSAMEIMRRGTISAAAPDGKLLRHTQLMGIFAMREGWIAQIAPGEGKTYTAMLHNVWASIHRGGSALLLTSSDPLVYEAMTEGAGLFGDHGVRFVQIDPDQRVPEPIAGIPTCYVSTKDTLGFAELRHNMDGIRFCGCVVDEIDTLAYSRLAYVISEGAVEVASPEYRQAVQRAMDFVDDQLARDGGLTPADFGRDPTRPRAPARLTAQGLEKARAGWGNVLSDDEITLINAAGAVRLNDFVEKRHFEWFTDAKGTRPIILDPLTGLPMRDPRTSTESRWHDIAPMLEAARIKDLGPAAVGSGMAIHGNPATRDQITLVEVLHRHVVPGALTGMSGTALNTADALSKVFGTGKAVDVERYQEHQLRKLGDFNGTGWLNIDAAQDLDGRPVDIGDTTGDLVHKDQRQKLAALIANVNEITFDDGAPQIVAVHNNDDVGTIAKAARAWGLEVESVDAAWVLAQGEHWQAKLAELVNNFGHTNKILVINLAGGRGIDYKLFDDWQHTGGIVLHLYGRSALSLDIDIQMINRVARNGDQGRYIVYTALDDHAYDRPDDPNVREIVVRYHSAEQAHDAAILAYAAEPTPGNLAALDRARAEMTHAQAAVRGITPVLQREAMQRMMLEFLQSNADTLLHRLGPQGDLHALSSVASEVAEPAPAATSMPDQHQPRGAADPAASRAQIAADNSATHHESSSAAGIEQLIAARIRAEEVLRSAERAHTQAMDALRAQPSQATQDGFEHARNALGSRGELDRAQADLDRAQAEVPAHDPTHTNETETSAQHDTTSADVNGNRSATADLATLLKQPPENALRLLEQAQQDQTQKSLIAALQPSELWTDSVFGEGSDAIGVLAQANRPQPGAKGNRHGGRPTPSPLYSPAARTDRNRPRGDTDATPDRIALPTGPTYEGGGGATGSAEVTRLSAAVIDEAMPTGGDQLAESVADDRVQTEAPAATGVCVTHVYRRYGMPEQQVPLAGIQGLQFAGDLGIAFRSCPEGLNGAPPLDQVAEELLSVGHGAEAVVVEEHTTGSSSVEDASVVGAHTKVLYNDRGVIWVRDPMAGNDFRYERGRRPSTSVVATYASLLAPDPEASADASREASPTPELISPITGTQLRPVHSFEPENVGEAGIDRPRDGVLITGSPDARPFGALWEAHSDAARAELASRFDDPGLIGNLLDTVQDLAQQRNPLRDPRIHPDIWLSQVAATVAEEPTAWADRLRSALTRVLRPDEIWPLALIVEEETAHGLALAVSGMRAGRRQVADLLARGETTATLAALGFDAAVVHDTALAVCAAVGAEREVGQIRARRRAEPAREQANDTLLRFSGVADPNDYAAISGALRHRGARVLGSRQPAERKDLDVTRQAADRQAGWARPALFDAFTKLDPAAREYLQLRTAGTAILEAFELIGQPTEPSERQRLHDRAMNAVAPGLVQAALTSAPELVERALMFMPETHRAAIADIRTGRVPLPELLPSAGAHIAHPSSPPALTTLAEICLSECAPPLALPSEIGPYTATALRYHVAAQLNGEQARLLRLKLWLDDDEISQALNLDIGDWRLGDALGNAISAEIAKAAVMDGASIDPADHRAFMRWLRGHAQKPARPAPAGGRGQRKRPTPDRPPWPDHPISTLPDPRPATAAEKHRAAEAATLLAAGAPWISLTENQFDALVRARPRQLLATAAPWPVRHAAAMQLLVRERHAVWQGSVHDLAIESQADAARRELTDLGERSRRAAETLAAVRALQTRVATVGNGWHAWLVSFDPRVGAAVFAVANDERAQRGMLTGHVMAENLPLHLQFRRAVELLVDAARWAGDATTPVGALCLVADSVQNDAFSDLADAAWIQVHGMPTDADLPWSEQVRMSPADQYELHAAIRRHQGLELRDPALISCLDCVSALHQALGYPGHTLSDWTVAGERRMGDRILVVADGNGNAKVEVRWRVTPDPLRGPEPDDAAPRLAIQMALNVDRYGDAAKAIATLASGQGTRALLEQSLSTLLTEHRPANIWVDVWTTGGEQHVRAAISEHDDMVVVREERDRQRLSPDDPYVLLEQFAEASGQSIDEVRVFWPDLQQLSALLRDSPTALNGQAITAQRIAEFAIWIASAHEEIDTSPEATVWRLLEATHEANYYGLLDPEAAPEVHQLELGAVMHLTRLSAEESHGPGSLWNLVSTVADCADPRDVLHRYTLVHHEHNPGIWTDENARAVLRPIGLAELRRWKPSREYASFAYWDVLEYVLRNYHQDEYPGIFDRRNRRWTPRYALERVIRDDAEILRALFAIFEKLGIEPGSWSSAIDFGAGSNLYPAAVAQLMTQRDGRVVRLVYHGNQPELEYNWVLADLDGDGLLRDTSPVHGPRNVDTRRHWLKWPRTLVNAARQSFPHVSGRGLFARAMGSPVIPGEAAEFSPLGVLSPLGLLTAPRFGFGSDFYVIDSVFPYVGQHYGALLCELYGVENGLVSGWTINNGQGYWSGSNYYRNTRYNKAEREGFLHRVPRVIAVETFEYKVDASFSENDEGLAVNVTRTVPHPSESDIAELAELRSGLVEKVCTTVSDNARDRMINEPVQHERGKREKRVTDLARAGLPDDSLGELTAQLLESVCGDWPAFAATLTAVGVDESACAALASAARAYQDAAVRAFDARRDCLRVELDTVRAEVETLLNAALESLSLDARAELNTSGALFDELLDKQLDPLDVYERMRVAGVQQSAIDQLSGPVAYYLGQAWVLSWGDAQAAEFAERRAFPHNRPNGDLPQIVAAAGEPQQADAPVFSGVPQAPAPFDIITLEERNNAEPAVPAAHEVIIPLVSDPTDAIARLTAQRIVRNAASQRTDEIEPILTQLIMRSHVTRLLMTVACPEDFDLVILTTRAGDWLLEQTVDTYTDAPLPTKTAIRMPFNPASPEDLRAVLEAGLRSDGFVEKIMTAVATVDPGMVSLTITRPPGHRAVELATGRHRQIFFETDVYEFVPFQPLPELDQWSPTQYAEIARNELMPVHVDLSESVSDLSKYAAKYLPQTSAQPQPIPHDVMVRCDVPADSSWEDTVVTRQPVTVGATRSKSRRGVADLRLPAGTLVIWRADTEELYIHSTVHITRSVSDRGIMRYYGVAIPGYGNRDVVDTLSEQPAGHRVVEVSAPESHRTPWQQGPPASQNIPPGSATSTPWSSRHA
ncbi:hypothetical protein [Nocardia sp. NPDC057030]|uniref:hypothetical protein n=1 Tax=unclassified Nocardia TaxID=2637762 RepID=UPI003637CE80